MNLIIGLGNWGAKYKKNRHNVGFMVLDELTQGTKFNAGTKFKAEVLKTKREGEEVILCKPQTFMNASGEAVGKVSRFYQIKTDQILVVHDDLDLPLGEVRVSQGSGAAGHKGVESIIKTLKTKEFTRVRLGIGRPEPNKEVEDFVLSDFRDSERKMAEEMVDRAVEMVYLTLKEGFGRSSPAPSEGKAHFQAVGDVLERFNPVEDKYISREFQQYGYDLAEELGDLKHKSLYFKLAKENPRVILERARSFVKDANARNPGRLFMWKLEQIKKEVKEARGSKKKTKEKK